MSRKLRIEKSANVVKFKLKKFACRKAATNNLPIWMRKNGVLPRGRRHCQQRRLSSRSTKKTPTSVFQPVMALMCFRVSVMLFVFVTESGRHKELGAVLHHKSFAGLLGSFNFFAQDISNMCCFHQSFSACVAFHVFYFIVAKGFLRMK